VQLSWIQPEQQAAAPWRNGGGSTREVFRCGDPDAFRWRLSIARVERAGPFSAFPHHQRQIALLDGGPLELAWPDGATLAVAPRLKAHRLQDGEPPVATLGEAPALVANLIHAPEVDGELIPRPLVGSMVFFDQRGTDWLILMLSGEAEFRIGGRHQWLGSGHALHLAGDGSEGRGVLDGGGEVVLARVRGSDVLTRREV
jgi:uncharacterized protein